MTAFVLWSQDAAADSREADALAAEAVSLASRNNYGGAAAKFRAAYAADPRPELICNIGIAYQKAGNQQTRAQLFLSQCLTRGSSLDSAFVDAVRKVLVSLEAKLRAGPFTPIDVVVEPPGASVAIDDFGPDEAFIGSRLIWLSPGAHMLRFRSEGHVEQSHAVDATSNAHRTLRITLERTPQAESPVPPTTIRSTAPAAPAAPTTPIAPASRLLPFGTTVASGVLGLTAGLTYLKARGLADDAAAKALTSPARSDYDAAVDRAHSWQYVSWALGGAAIVTAGASVFLWYRATRTPRVEVHATASGGSIGVSGSF